MKHFTQKTLFLSIGLTSAWSVNAALTVASPTLITSPKTVVATTITTTPTIAPTTPIKTDPALSVSEKPTLEDTKIKVINGEKFTIEKWSGADGESFTTIINADGKEISERDLPLVKPEIISAEVIKWAKKLLSEGDILTTASINIALDINVAETVITEVGTGEIRDGEVVQSEIDGRKLTPKELDTYTSQFADKVRRLQDDQNKQRQNALIEWANNNALSKAPGFKDSIERGGDTLTVHLTAEQVMRLIEVADKQLVGVEFTPASRDTIDSAMADTNITNWALPFAATRGDGIGIYMTESGCANESRLDNYDRLAGSETNHSRNVSAILRAVSPNAFIYCRGNAVLPKNSDLDGVGGNDRIYIMTRSNGDPDSKNYNTLDRNWDNFAYNNSLVSFVSAGNEGNGTGYTVSPAKGLNMVTVGNYNDANDTIAGSSSFLDPNNIGNAKPEISGPGTNITAGGFTMSGTSMSCPHAAAFTADMMSSSTYLKYRPYLAKAKVMAGATDPISGGFDKVGLGGIDFLSAQYSGYWSWWSGANNSWNYFDGLDGSKDGYVTRKIYISASWNKARVALAWMNRGSYTYSHRNNAHAIGTDLDLKVYAPNGNLVGSSASWDNPFEYVNFTPTQSGYYTVKIKRYANRDSSSAVRMGLYVNYYN